MDGVVCDKRHGMGHRRSGNPEIVGSDKLIRFTQIPGNHRILVCRCFIHWQDIEACQHRSASGMPDVAKSFREFACRNPRQARAGCKMLLEELVGFSLPSQQFPLQINQKTSVKKKVTHDQELSGGRSSCWADSRCMITASSAAGICSHSATNAPHVLAC